MKFPLYIPWNYDPHFFKLRTKGRKIPRPNEHEIKLLHIEIIMGIQQE